MNSLPIISQDARIIYNMISPILPYLKESKDDGHFDCTINPFFMPPENIDIKEQHVIKQTIVLKNYEIVFNKYLLMMYNMLRDTKTQMITNKHWILFSLEEIYQKSRDYKSSYNQISWTDIGLVYRGMGHVEVLRMDITNGELFFQPDGGSNGYDRQDYFDKYIKQQITSDMYVSIDDVFKIIFEIN